MSRTITVEGDVNAVNTRTLLTAQGSITAPSLVVPAGMHKITKIIASVTSDGAADDGAACAFIRLGGNAVLNGEQSIFIGAVGGQTVQSGSDAAPSISEPFVLDDAAIEVRPSDTISIAAELGGVDPGDTSVAVTLVYGP
jgi:hypothetical protein